MKLVPSFEDAMKIVEESKKDHDCKLSEDDSCEVCERKYEHSKING